MMKVCYSEMDTPAGLSCRLEAAGHAGYAPAGQDIVCAGASTVMQGLVYLLAGEENAYSEAFDEPDAPRLAVSVDAPCEEWVRGVFELAKACFVLLAERYPENVRFADVSRRGKESMMDLQLFAAEATAACGGNREPRLGQRPAEHECRSRHEVDAESRNPWGAFMLQGDGISLYYSGDTGYSSHFREIPDLFGAPDYALLGIGAYKPRWFMCPNHISPHESLTAAEEMHAGLTIPMHYGTFDLSDEPLHDPPKVFAAEAKKRKIPVEIPYLGEIVKLRKQK